MTLPEYRYFTADMLTGQVLGELPLYGVFMDKQIKRSGNLTGTFRLDTGVEDDAELMSSSYPQKTRIYCQRDGTTIWGGIIWVRTYESNARTIQLQAQTFESYIGKVAIKSNFVRTNTSQLQILKDLVDLMQSNARSNIGIVTSGLVTAGGNLKSIAVPFYDYKYFIDAISELADADDGFDWYIDVQDSAVTDQPVLTLLAGQPIIAPTNQMNVTVYDYPGSIEQFYWPESGGRSGTDFILLGAGSGSNMLQAVGTWNGAANYPEVDQIFTRKDITNQTSLNSIAAATAATYGASISNPTIILKSDTDPEFDGWNNLGGYYRFDLESPRFPLGKSLTKRMLGWELSPASSEQVETVKLLIEGDEIN